MTKYATLIIKHPYTVRCDCKNCAHAAYTPHRTLPICTVGPEFQMDCRRDGFEHWKSKLFDELDCEVLDIEYQEVQEE